MSYLKQIRDSKPAQCVVAAMLLLTIVVVGVDLTSKNAPAKWTREMDSLAKHTEAKYNLPHGVCRAMAEKETGYNQHAFRVEISYTVRGGFYYDSIVARSRRFCRSEKWDGSPSLQTEISQRGSSWTMWQIMFDNMRIYCGATNEFATEITLHESFDHFAKFFIYCRTIARGDLHKTLVIWNGGPSAAKRGRAHYARLPYDPFKYADDVMKRVSKYTY